MKKKFGIKSQQEEDNIEEVLEGKSMLGRKRSRRKLRREQMMKDNLVAMITDKKEQEELDELMTEEERLDALREKAKIQQLFRDDSIGYQPIIIKASQTGVLETLLIEADNIIQDQFQINIVNTGIGPLVEKDLHEAQQMGAIIFGFDIQVAPNIGDRIRDAGVAVRMHKLIYKFQDDLDDLVHDIKEKQKLKSHRGMQIEATGEAHVHQIFKVTESGPKKGSPKRHITVAGCQVVEGDIDRRMRFRLLRNDELIKDEMTLHTLKHYKKDVSKVERGMECGIALEGLPKDFEMDLGDVIECYEEHRADPDKFDYTPGLKSSY
jgi:translation initiation factor IF-2